MEVKDNIVSNLRPMYVMSKFLGIAYFTINTSPNGISISKCSFWYSFLFISVYLGKIVGFFLNFLKYFHEEIDKNAGILQYLMLFQAFSGILITTVMFIFSFGLRGDGIKIWTKLRDLDATLKEENYEVNYKYVKLKCLVMIAMQIILYGIFTGNLVDHNSNLQQLLLFYEWQLLRMAFKVQFASWIIALKYIFSAICRKLENMFKNDENNLDIQEIKINVCSLRNIHDECCDLLRDINICFAIEMLSMIGMDFTTVIFLSYNIYILNKKHTIEPMMPFIIWFVLYNLDVFLLVNLCSKCCYFVSIIY